MRSTDGERGGGQREEGSGVIKGAAAGIQWSLTEQPEEVDCPNVWLSYGLNHITKCKKNPACNHQHMITQKLLKCHTNDCRVLWFWQSPAFYIRCDGDLQARNSTFKWPHKHHRVWDAVNQSFTKWRLQGILCNLCPNITRNLKTQWRQQIISEPQKTSHTERIKKSHCKMQKLKEKVLTQRAGGQRAEKWWMSFVNAICSKRHIKAKWRG